MQVSILIGIEFKNSLINGGNFLYFYLCSKPALTETLEIDQYMWAILNTLSGNQEVDEVVIDNSANWTPLRIGGGMMNGNPSVDNSNGSNNPMNSNNGPSSVPPAIKVSISIPYPPELESN